MMHRVNDVLTAARAHLIHHEQEEARRPSPALAIRRMSAAAFFDNNLTFLLFSLAEGIAKRLPSIMCGAGARLCVVI